MNDLQKKEKQIRKQLDEAYQQQDKEKLLETAKSLIMLTVEIMEK